MAESKRKKGQCFPFSLPIPLSPSSGSSAFWFCGAWGDHNERLAIIQKIAFKFYSFSWYCCSRLFHSRAFNLWFLSGTAQAAVIWSPAGELQLLGVLGDAPRNCSKAFCVQGSPRAPGIALVPLVIYLAAENPNTSLGRLFCPFLLFSNFRNTWFWITSHKSLWKSLSPMWEIAWHFFNETPFMSL